MDKIQPTVMEACLAAGTIVSGPRHSFVLEKVLGKGGFGITYRGQEIASKRKVAIKEYFPNRCQPCRMPDGTILPLSQYQEVYQSGKKSFLNEAAMLRALDDIPSVVRILDFFPANGTAYMVMEYLDGTTLRQMVERGGKIPVHILRPRLTPLIRDICAIHERGVLHRDIAPDNIMWMPDGTLKLMDFGCARAMEDGRSMTVQLKPGFAPAEQYGSHGQGDYTDLYALCATIYYCITGIVPAAAPERQFALYDDKPDPLVWPHILDIPLSPDWEALLMWGLQLNPEMRPQKVQQWLERAEALTVWSDTEMPVPEPVPAPDPPPIQPNLKKLPILHWLIIGLCIAAALSVLVGLVALAKLI